MKRLDDSTLEAIAEAICGQGEGAGGGYTAPGPYRLRGGKWLAPDSGREGGPSRTKKGKGRR